MFPIAELAGSTQLRTGMPFSTRTKQTAIVTALVGSAVATLGAFYVTGVSTAVLHDSQAKGRILVNAIFHRAQEVVKHGDDPYKALRDDPGLQSILEASIFSESVTGASILDTNGVIIASSDPNQIGRTLAPRADLSALVSADAVSQLRVIYSLSGRTFEVREPLLLGDQGLGSISVGMSTLLMQRQLDDSLQPALLVAIVTMIVTMVVAGIVVSWGFNRL
jgi:sensor histidine kinase regulating citrate/malate metabolism